MRASAIIQLDGKDCRATFKPISLGMRYGIEVTVADEVFRFYTKLPFYNHIDEEFTARGDTRLRFVYHMGECDLVQNRQYVSTKKSYPGVPAFSVWTLFCMLLSLSLPVLTLGGAFPILAGTVSAAYVFSVGRSPFAPTWLRMLHAAALPLILGGCFWMMHDGFALFSLLSRV